MSWALQILRLLSQVTPQQGQELRMSGIYPGNQTTFLMPKAMLTVTSSDV